MTTSPDSVSYPIVGYGLAVALDDGNGTYNWATLTESGTGQPARVLANGYDSNVSLALVPKGTGGVIFGSNYANYVTITGAAAGSDPVIAVAGSDTNIDMVLRAKGSGGLILGDNLANYATITGGGTSGSNGEATISTSGSATNSHLKLTTKSATSLVRGDRPLLFSTSSNLDTLAGLRAAPTAVWFHNNYTYTAAAAPVYRWSGGASGSITSGTADWGLFAIDADTVDPTTGSGPGGMSGFRVGHVLTGGKGGRTALSAGLFITGAFTSSATGAGSFQTAGGFRAVASASAGGSAGLGNQRGNLFGINPIVELNSGAGLYWQSITGGEITIKAGSGTGINYKVGFQVVQGLGDAVAGASGVDAGFLIGNQTTGAAPIGWDVGYCFASPWTWWPLKATGTMIGTGTPFAGGPAFAAAYGVDFRAVTFSTAAFASTGFEVDGIGRTTGAAFILGTGGPRIVPGTGAPSALLVLTKGSLYLRTDGAVGSTLYVTQGGGTWNAVAGV